MRAKGKREIIGALATIALIAAYWIGSEIYYAHSISPRGISTAGDYLKRFGEPKSIRAVKHGGKDYYEFTGSLPPRFVIALPSSPPVYVFDEQGRFVTWCSDPGDAHGYYQQWPFDSTNRLELKTVKERLGLQ
jgi:hypothetical protein